MSRSWLRALGAVFALLLGVLPTGATAAAARATFTYDVTTVARVDVRASGGADSGSTQFTGLREWSALPSTQARGTSTTPFASVVATEAASGPVEGQTVYRVYGGDSAAGGASWSPTNPGSVANFRDAAGLPSGGASGATNTGQFVIEGTITDPSKVVLVRNALPLDGMTGGLPEYIIPNWLDNGAINITRVSGANPRF